MLNEGYETISLKTTSNITGHYISTIKRYTTIQNNHYPLYETAWFLLNGAGRTMDTRVLKSFNSEKEALKAHEYMAKNARKEAQDD